MSAHKPLRPSIRSIRPTETKGKILSFDKLSRQRNALVHLQGDQVYHTLQVLVPGDWIGSLAL
jgi:hypothetical protein